MARREDSLPIAGSRLLESEAKSSARSLLGGGPPPRMEEQELLALRETREKLIEKANRLLEAWQQHRRGVGCGRTLTIDLPSPEQPQPRRVEGNAAAAAAAATTTAAAAARLCQVSQRVTGIEFKNVEKKWLGNDLYLYTALVETKTIQFYLELTVELKNNSDEEFEVTDITCHFVDQDAYSMAEIQPFVQSITRRKNFSLLMTAVSQYTEYGIVRAKIIRNLETGGYATLQQHPGKKAGLLLHLHPSDKLATVYLKLHWSIAFLETTWHIEHLFSIHPTKHGTRFAEEQKELLVKFCKLGLDKTTLLNLWTELCNALDALQENRATEDSPRSLSP